MMKCGSADEFFSRLVELLSVDPGTEFNISMDVDRSRIVVWSLGRDEPYLEVGGIPVPEVVPISDDKESAAGNWSIGTNYVVPDCDWKADLSKLNWERK